jgi:16S rRNA (guanine527-N7)-methyltransferase
LSAELPEIARGDFATAIARLSPVEVLPQGVERLWIHYNELARWNRRASLVGPGTAEQVLDRHYGESLVGLGLLEDEDRSLVDIGSGAGFPGFVLSAVRPDLGVTLVEATQKKWSFLSLVCEKSALPCRCLNARVTTALARELPQQIDVVTTRAVKLSAAEISLLAGRLSPRGRFLIWSGRTDAPDLARLRAGREARVPGSQHRRIRELFPDR